VRDDLPCELGLRDFKACPHYTEGTVAPGAADGTTATNTEAIDDDAFAQRLPWTGRALGLADMALVSSRSPARLVGLIGPFNAGKTGLLTAMFSHFAKTGSAGDFDFAGSFTLHGWSELRHHTAWPSPHSGNFPPHTPDNGQRVPSLLHLAFRKPGGPLRDLLFTDAPGEWFSRWLTNQNAADAQGAVWIADNATHFIFVVDREGLAGNDVGRIRWNTLALARILGENLRGRPVLAIWTKSDTKCDEEIEGPIRSKLLEFFGPHTSLNLSVEDPGCVRVLETLLEEPPLLGYKSPSTAPASAFLAYAGFVR
jgi:hypothetical protein